MRVEKLTSLNLWLSCQPQRTRKSKQIFGSKSLSVARAVRLTLELPMDALVRIQPPSCGKDVSGAEGILYLYLA